MGSALPCHPPVRLPSLLRLFPPFSPLFSTAIICHAPKSQAYKLLHLLHILVFCCLLSMIIELHCIPLCSHPNKVVNKAIARKTGAKCNSQSLRYIRDFGNCLRTNRNAPDLTNSDQSTAALPCFRRLSTHSFSDRL